MHPNPSEPETWKLSNPKDILGSNKLPLSLWPTTATAMGCIGMLNGMLKYGRANFRVVGIRMSIYIDACLRHLFLLMEGEECDQDDGVPHIAAALACLGIIVDAMYAGLLNDDRNYPGGYQKALAELTPHVERLKLLHAARTPKHYHLGTFLVDSKGNELVVDPPKGAGNKSTTDGLWGVEK